MPSTAACGWPGTVRSLIVVLTAACNLRCAYCYQGAKRSARMAWGTLRAVLDAMLSSPGIPMKLEFLGGEPLLELESMRRAVRYLERRTPSRRRFRYATITNGTLLNEAAGDFLVAHAFDVSLSFDGVPAAQDLRQPGSSDRLDGVLDALLARHPDYCLRHLTINMTVTPENLAWLADSVSYFLAKGVADIAIAPDILDQPDWRRQDIDELDAQLRRVRDASLLHWFKNRRTPVKLMRQRRRARLVRVGSGALTPSEAAPRRRDGALCSGGTGAALVIDVDGRVFSCPLLASSSRRTGGPLAQRLRCLDLGDFRAADFVDRHAAFAAAAHQTQLFHHRGRKYSPYGRCADCRFASSCSVCPLSSTTIAGNEDPHRLPAFACAFHRTAAKYRGMSP